MLGATGALGEAMMTPVAGYLVVYHLEIGLMFVCLAVLGPLVGRRAEPEEQERTVFGLAGMPG